MFMITTVTTLYAFRGEPARGNKILVVMLVIVCNVRQGDSGDVYDYYGDYIICI